MENPRRDPPVLPDGLYTMRGGDGINLIRDPATGRLTVGFYQGLPTPAYAVWEVKAMYRESVRGRDAGDAPLPVAIFNTQTNERICATDPSRSRGGEPLRPPAQGAPVTLIGPGEDDNGYALWIPWILNGGIALSAFYSEYNAAMVLNIAGNSWGPGSNIITWPAGLGDRNEKWWFLPDPFNP